MPNCNYSCGEGGGRGQLTLKCLMQADIKKLRALKIKKAGRKCTTFFAASTAQIIFPGHPLPPPPRGRNFAAHLKNWPGEKLQLLVVSPSLSC